MTNEIMPTAPLVRLGLSGDLVYVYRSGGRAEFRRPDHRPPSGLSVSNLSSIVCRTPTQVIHVELDSAEPRTSEHVSAALAWLDTHQAPQTPSLPMFPYQQAAFQDLMRERNRIATVAGPLGSGMSRIAVAVAAARAVNEGIDTIHVVAPGPMHGHIEEEFDQAECVASIVFFTPHQLLRSAREVLAAPHVVAISVDTYGPQALARLVEYCDDNAQTASVHATRQHSVVVVRPSVARRAALPQGT